MTPEHARQYANSLPEYAKVWYDGKVYDFGYLGQRGQFVLYEEGERNMQDSVAVDPDLVEVASEDRFAEQFRGVEYSYHRDLFEAMGLPEIAEKFAEIWGLCEPHLYRYHALAAVGSGADWAEPLEAPHRRHRFLTALSGVLKLEAEADEGGGRPVLARKLREAVALIKSDRGPG